VSHPPTPITLDTPVATPVTPIVGGTGVKGAPSSSVSTTNTINSVVSAITDMKEVNTKASPTASATASTPATASPSPAVGVWGAKRSFLDVSYTYFIDYFFSTFCTCAVDNLYFSMYLLIQPLISTLSYIASLLIIMTFRLIGASAIL
jgi:hypothetical protein